MVVKCIKNELLHSATYFVGKYLVDCGDADKILGILDGKELKGIFLTHCHQDHIYGIGRVLECYPYAKVYCSQRTFLGLKDDEKNLSYIMPEHPIQFTKENNVVVLDEGVYFLDGLKIEVISTPGHSDDCLTYIIEGNIFTGDSYIPFAKVFTKWPTSNNALALENEAKLNEISKQRNLRIYPGHWQ